MCCLRHSSSCLVFPRSVERFLLSKVLSSVGLVSSFFLPFGQCPGRLLVKIGRDPSVSKSNRLHVNICWFFFIDLRYIL